MPWLAAQTGPKVAPHVAALSYKTWTTLSEFIRQQALVGFVKESAKELTKNVVTIERAPRERSGP